MAQVPIRPPRFLGEKVPYREQSMQERIQQELGPNYTVEKSDGGYVAKAKPVQYLRVRDTRTKKVRAGQTETYGTYIPKEIIISSEGKVLKEISRGVANTDATGPIRTWEVYDTDVTDYEKQTRYTYGTRDIGTDGKTRESIRETSSQVSGVYTEKRLIDQDSKEYQKRTEEQKELLREKGFTVKNTEEYAVAGLNKEQREAYYKQKAKERSDEFSLKGKAITVQHEAQRQFQEELGSESQKYASDIQAKQIEQRPKPISIYVPKETPSQPQYQFEVSPSGKVTRTDMTDKPFQIVGLPPSQELQVVPPQSEFKQFITSESKKGGIKGFFYSTISAPIQTPRTVEELNIKASRSRVAGNVVSGVGYNLAEFGLSVPVGGVKLIKSVATQPQEVIGGMFNPASYKQLGVELATRPAKTTGEITGAVLTGYGIGKGIQAVTTRIKTNKPQDGGSNIGGTKIKTQEFQSRFPEKGRQVDIVTSKELRFLKEKTGKGQIESTVFSSKRVIQDGKVIQTPEITKLRTEIVGKPSNIGTIKVEKTIQTPLVEGKVIARSKWIPGDIRPIIVKNGKVYTTDWTGGQIRPYRSGTEFTLETIYPSKGGLAPSQQSMVSGKTLNYEQTIQTPYGSVVFNKPPTPGTQTTLYPKEIVIGKVTPPKTTIIKPMSGSVITDATPSQTISYQSGSQTVIQATPQKYATAGEVLAGTIKVYPKYQVGSAKVISQTTQPISSAPITPKSSSSLPYILGGVAGATIKTPQMIAPSTQPKPISLSKPFTDYRVRAEPSIKVSPESISISRAEAKAEAESIVSPVSVLDPLIRSRGHTETRVKTELRTELIPEMILETDIITRTTPITKLPPPPPPPDVPPPPPPKIPFSSGSDKKPGGGFLVQVRKKGVFKTIAVTETPQEAFRIGKFNVEQTASASLRVKPIKSGEKVTGIGKSILPLTSFRESKREPDTFIQRRQFRISSPGEKREITQKGLLKLRSKNIFGRMK